MKTSIRTSTRMKMILWSPCTQTSTPWGCGESPSPPLHPPPLHPPLTPYIFLADSQKWFQLRRRRDQGNSTHPTPFIRTAALQEVSLLQKMLRYLVLSLQTRWCQCFNQLNMVILGHSCQLAWLAPPHNHSPHQRQRMFVSTFYHQGQVICRDILIDVNTDTNYRYQVHRW